MSQANGIRFASDGTVGTPENGGQLTVVREVSPEKQAGKLWLCPVGHVQGAFKFVLNIY